MAITINLGKSNLSSAGRQYNKRKKLTLFFERTTHITSIRDIVRVYTNYIPESTYLLRFGQGSDQVVLVVVVITVPEDVNANGGRGRTNR